MFSSDLTKSHRIFEVKQTDCCLCMTREVVCFCFQDNEGYGFERICAKCLKEASDLLEQKTQTADSE